MNLPKIDSYGDYSSSNYGVNCLNVVFPNGFELNYSYKTIIAFRDHLSRLVISENCWGNTTGKHLNWINKNKTLRLKRDEFEKQLNDELSFYGLNDKEAQH